jgi:dTDP-glucose pyrophosphorylase
MERNYKVYNDLPSEIIYVDKLELSKYISKSKLTIHEAMEKLNNTIELFQIIVDENNLFLGTLTDGDIRRGLLRGYNLDDNVTEFMNSKALLGEYGKEDKNIEKLKMVDREPFFLPILNNTKEVAALLIKDDSKIIPQAIIMAGGLGTRLGDLTKHTPKPMLEIKGKPILEYCIKQLEDEGIENIYISVNYLAEKITKYIEKRKSKSKIIPVYEENKLGTIGPLSLISKNITGPIFVMNADLLTNVSLQAMIAFHLNGRFSSTIASATYEANIPCGVLNSNQLGCLHSIDEKPTINYMVAGGLYILNKEIYDLLEHNKYYDMPDLLNDAVQKNFSNSLFPIHEKWTDIGRIDEYNKAKNQVNEKI